MAADSATVLSRITEILNVCAAGGFSATIAGTNLDRNATAISEMSREAAMMIARAIVSNPRHVHRNAFVSATPTSLTHQGELPDMAGEMDLVQIQPYSGADWQTGAPKDVQQIESYRANPSNIYGTIAHTTSGSRLSGYYAIANGRFYFTGYAARGFFPVIARDTVSGLIPDEYEDVWVKLGVGLALKEGDNMGDIAGYYMQYGQQDLLAISTMGVVQAMPAIPKAQKARGNE